MIFPIHYNRQPRTRCGLTLTELLVVVAIIVLIAGVTIPMMRPVLKGRKVREAARIVNVFFAGAQARAAEQGRPVGVWLERADHGEQSFDENNPATWNPNQYKVYKIYTAIQPAPYSGDSYDARARVVTYWDQSPLLHTSGLIPNLNTRANVIIPLSDVASFPVLNRGEEIQFNYRGGRYRITEIPHLTGPNQPFPLTHATNYSPPFDNMIPPASDMYVRFEIEAIPVGRPAPLNPLLLEAAVKRDLGRFAGQPVPFQIFRLPKKSIVAPIEMPTGTTIDLSLSGVDSDNALKFRFGNDGISRPTAPGQLVQYAEVPPLHDIAIMFSPDGPIDRVYFMRYGEDTMKAKSGNPLHPWIASRSREATSVSLFIGRDELVGVDQNKQVVVQHEQGVPVSSNVLPNTLVMGEQNLNDKTNIWLSISGKRITNTPNAGLDSSSIPVTGLPPMSPIDFFDDYIRHARQLTRSGLSMGEQ